MEELDRYHQALIPGMTHQDSLHAVERAPTNAHALARTQEGMRVKRNFLVDRGSQTLDLFVGDRSSLPLTADESQHTGSPQHFQPLFGLLCDAHEGVATKQRGFHRHPPVAPPVEFLNERKKRADSCVLQLCGHSFFMPRQSVNRVPTRFLWSGDSQRKVTGRFQVY